MPDDSRPEPSPDNPESVGAPKRKAAVKKRHTVGRVVTLSLMILALLTGLGTVFFLRHLDGNIVTGSLNDLGPGRPERVYKGNGKPLNILVMGDDTREGKNKIDNESGGGSDTTIVVHLSADRTRAYAVSIPRDSIIDRPACNDGDSPAATDVMWNAAFSVGGETCTADQFEQTTGIRLDHYAVLDFNGFGQMVDAVGGVPVCVPEDIVDKKRSIFVPAGNPSLLTGDQALDYVRARYVGPLIQQNDISRIRRQQEFIGALVREVKSAGTLTRLDKVVRFLDAATKSLRTDDGLSVTGIGRIAMQLQSIGLDKVQFVTLPTDYFPMDSEFRGKVFWTPEAEEIWKLLAEDKPLPTSLTGSVNAAGPGGSTTAPGSPSPSTSASESASPGSSSASPSTSEPSKTSEPEKEQIFGVCS